MKLPNAEQAVVDREKITDYLLSLTSPDGWSKARFFTRRGFTVGQWEVFAKALKAQGAAYEVAEIRETDQDIRYSVVGSIQTPDGSDPPYQNRLANSPRKLHPPFNHRPPAQEVKCLRNIPA